jgi:hypothetical protein
MIQKKVWEKNNWEDIFRHAGENLIKYIPEQKAREPQIPYEPEESDDPDDPDDPDIMEELQQLLVL